MFLFFCWHPVYGKVFFVNKKNFFGFVRSFMTSGFVFYIVLALLFLFCVDRVRLAAHAGPSTLSRLRPNYQALADIAKGKRPADRKTYGDMAVYLEKVNVVMGDRADARLLLGYCYFNLDDHKRSQENFAHALRLSDGYFWAYHGAGVLAMRRGDKLSASGYFRSALAISADQSLQNMLTSRIFLPFIVEAGYTPQDFFISLAQGRVEALGLLCTLLTETGDFQALADTARQGVEVALTDRDRAAFFYYMGFALRNIGQIPAAFKFQQEALKLSPEHPGALQESALVLKAAGQSEAASFLLERAGTNSGKASGFLFDAAAVLVRAF